MPRLSEMFPPKTISGEMLPPREIVCRIKDVDYEIGTNRETGQQEPWWRIYFEGWPLPLRLNKTNSTVIANVLGSDATEDWVGRDIVIEPRPDTDRSGKPYVAVGVKLIRPSQPPELAPPRETAMILGGKIPLPPRGQVARLPEPPKPPSRTPIGEKGRQWVLDELRRRGKSWSDFCAAIKYAPGAEQILNTAIEDIPGEVLRSMFRSYLADHPLLENPPPPDATDAPEATDAATTLPGPGAPIGEETFGTVQREEIIDPSTGEVIQGGPEPHDPLDDIPF